MTDSGRLTGSREPSPSSTGLDPSGFDPERIVAAFNKRLTIYRTKRDAAHPLAADCYNRQDATRYVVEAIEILAQEAGLSASVFIEPDPDEMTGCADDQIWASVPTETLRAAIATEAATAAETVKLGSVHEGAGRRHRPHTPSLQTPQGGDS